MSTLDARTQFHVLSDGRVGSQLFLALLVEFGGRAKRHETDVAKANLVYSDDVESADVESLTGILQIGRGKDPVIIIIERSSLDALGRQATIEVATERDCVMDPVTASDRELLQFGFHLEHAREFGMCGWAMVAFDGIVLKHLPVSWNVPLVIEAECMLFDIETALPHERVHSFDPGLKWGRGEIQVRPHHRSPDMSLDRDQSELSRLESCVRVAARSVKKLAIQTVCPAVKHTIQFGSIA